MASFSDRFFKSSFVSFPMGVVLYLELKTAHSDEIMEVGSEDPLVIVDQQEVSGGETRLPNSHSAALVMVFIFLCLLAYGIYRFCKWKCGRQEPSLTFTVGANKESLTELGIKDLERYAKEREEYLAIYGPKRSTNQTCASGSKTELNAVSIK